MIKKLRQLGIVLLSCLGIAGSGVAATPALPAPQKTPLVPLDRIVAVVNDEVITQTQLNQQTAIAKKQLQSMHAPLPNDTQLKKQVLQQLIDRSLQMQAAKRAGLEVNTDEVDHAIADIAQRNHLTVAQLRQALSQQGMNFTAYRQQIHDQILLSKLQQQALAGGITVTQDDVNNFIKSGQNVNQAANQYHLRDIVVPLPATPSPAQIDAARDKANDIIKQLRAGTDFEKIAIAQSSGDQALSGGDLGWRHLAEMPTIFAQQVVNMKVGSIAGPIRAPNGFHVVQLVDIKTSTQKLTQPQIRQLIFERKMQEKVEAWVQQLRKEAYIKIM